MLYLCSRLLDLQIEQLYRSAAMPFSISLWEVGTHQVSTHGCHNNMGHHVVLELVSELKVPGVLIGCWPLPAGKDV